MSADSEIPTLDFSMLLASSVHDVKNILGSVMESIDWLSSGIEGLTEEQKNEFVQVSQLISYVNSDLMQLLCFFKLENKQFHLNNKLHNVEEFLELQVAFLQGLVKGDSIQLSFECDEMLNEIFDDTLIATVIRNAGMNAINISPKNISFTAEKKDGHLIFQIEDDGPGYPDAMLGEVKFNTTSVDLESSSTGLGLFFSQTIARLHAHENRMGKVVLGKSERLQGASFTLFIPVGS